MALRQQTAVEFLTTYSFAIFIISIMLVTAAAISLSYGTTPPIYSSCSIQPLITCEQSILTYNSAVPQFTYTLLLRNQLGFVMRFPASNAINFTATGIANRTKLVAYGACSPLVVPQGSQAICIVKAKAISQVKQGSTSFSQFVLAYSICTNQTASSCSTTYNATGFSYQTLSQAYTNLYNVTVQAYNGLLVINGQTYLNNSQIYLTSGSYIAYGQPSVGYGFQSLQWTGTGGWTETTSQTNTVVVASSGNIIVKFH